MSGAQNPSANGTNGAAGPAQTKSNPGNAQQQQGQPQLQMQQQLQQQAQYEARPLSANEQALGALERMGYKKGADTLKTSIQQQRNGERAEQGSGAAVSASTPQPAQAIKKEPPNGQASSNPQSNQSQPIRTQPLPENASLDEMLKRNIPQAFSASSSTVSYNITPEFMQQAENVVAMHLEKVQRNQNNAQGAGKSEITLLDSMERIRGYVKLRQWVESGLEGWKVSGFRVQFGLNDADKQASWLFRLG